MRTTSMALIAGVFIFMVGCPMNTDPPAAAVLAGNWMATSADGTAFAATFDADGKLVQITGTRADGESVTLDIDDATSVVTGTEFEIRIATDQGEVVFSGTISADGTALLGTLSGDVTIDDVLAIVIPRGDLSFDAEGSDDGNANDNDNGTGNENANAGDNANDNGTGNVNDNDNGTESDNENANASGNVNANANDNSMGDDDDGDDDDDNGAGNDNTNTNANANMNDNGNTNANTNDNGNANANTNANTNSNTNDNGSGGPSTGDAVSGESLVSANCAACHGADGASGFAPNIQRKSAASITRRAIDGQGNHTVFALTAQEVLDIEAFLGTF